MRKLLTVGVLIIFLAGCGYQSPTENGRYEETFYDPVNNLMVELDCGKGGFTGRVDYENCRITISEYYESIEK